MKFKFNIQDFNPKVYEWLQEKEQLEEMISFKTDAYSHAITGELAVS